ncbi:methyltransferase-like protein 4 [Takifugu rubripes]|uniref:methyltransferase-like protein 4 n=1 Tax=Takifugu rubripes TaxID=31033 RepID=UPI0011452B39|nr:methyltransferase-like protein 4 [Takifugu rubripes]XP_011606312.2 methyltransferase-like protein 4 [Takifugu rubripes]
MMSVVAQHTEGWVLDAGSLIDRGCSRCIRFKDHKQTSVSCHFKKQCFNVYKGYGSVNSSAAANGGNTDVLQKTDKLPKKRKRKNGDRNQGEVDSQAFHLKIRSVILDGTKALVSAAQALGYLNGLTDPTEEPLPSQECNLAALCDMAKELPLAEEQGEHSQPLTKGYGDTSHVDLFSLVTENAKDQGSVVSLMGEEYIIPPNSAFLLSDFTRIRPLVDYGRRFDLIVMDPPWENKSVKRSRRYSFLPSTQLKRLPIPLLACPNCLVVTWVTNRSSHLRFICDELYPHWGVQVVAQWFWVKVTTSGQFVFPLDSPHKKPYEVLVLGRYRCSPENTRSLETSEVPVEDQRLIVSVPSALHSQKPSLTDVLKPYVGSEPTCLELFARSLLPGWTSWGNEVLKFQHASYFTVTRTDDGDGSTGILSSPEDIGDARL